MVHLSGPNNWVTQIGEPCKHHKRPHHFGIRPPTWRNVPVKIHNIHVMHWYQEMYMSGCCNQGKENSPHVNLCITRASLGPVETVYKDRITVTLLCYWWYKPTTDKYQTKLYSNSLKSTFITPHKINYNTSRNKSGSFLAIYNMQVSI